MASVSVSYTGTSNIITPTHILLDPFIRPSDLHVWSMLRCVAEGVGKETKIQGATYELPQLIHMSRTTWNHSIKKLQVLRYIKLSTDLRDDGFIQGSVITLSDYPVEIEGYEDQYSRVLQKIKNDSDKKLALLAKYAEQSVGMNDGPVMITSMNGAVQNQLSNPSGPSWIEMASPGCHAIHPQLVRPLIKLLGSVKSKKSPVVQNLNHQNRASEASGSEIEPPEKSVVQKLNHQREEQKTGGSEFEPPAKTVVQKLNHQSGASSSKIEPPENQQLSSPSRARANVVCSSSKTTTTTTNSNRMIQKELTELIECERITEQQSKQFARIVRDLSDDEALDLVHEVVGRMELAKNSDQPVSNPAGYLHSMKRKLQSGEFIPTDAAALTIQILKEHREWQAQEAYLKKQDELARKGLLGGAE